MQPNKEILQAKIDVRYHSRELIKFIFMITEHFPKNEPEGIAPALRKKVLGISSFLTHGTVKSDREEQNEDFLLVMAELREVLKLVTISHHLGLCTDKEKVVARVGIAQLIDALDKLVKLLGGFDNG
jgi:hypothetical protein